MRRSSWSVGLVTSVLCAAAASAAHADSTTQPFPRRSWHPVAPPSAPAAAPVPAPVPAPAFPPPPPAPSASPAVVAAPPPALPPSVVPPPPQFPRTTVVIPVTPVPVRPQPIASRPPTPYAPAPAPVCPPPCATKNWYFTPWARVSYLSPSGEQFITKGGVPGSATWIDLEDDIDLDDSFVPELGLTVDYKRHRVKGSYEPIRFEGTTVLPRSVIFHAWTFVAGEEVTSEVNVDLWKLGYSYAIVDNPSLTVRAGLAGWVWTYDGRMTSHTTGAVDKRAFTHVLPVATAEAEVGLGGTWVARGAIRYGTVGADRYMFEAEAGVGVELMRHVGLELGWRYMLFSFVETTNLADMAFMGPYIGVSYTF